MALSFLNYQQIRENNKEFTRSDLWEIKFLTQPKCYFPGHEFINQRCTAVTPGVPNDIQVLSQEIRGFTVHQAGRQTSSGSATVTFVDREDLAIRTWVEEWKNLMSDRNTLASNRKSTYVCDLEITYFNTSRVPISKITLYNCVLSNASPAEDGTAEASLSSDIQLSLNYEHFERKYLNAI